MPDVVFTASTDCKVRVKEFKTFNTGNKQVEWGITAVIVNPDGTYGKSVHDEIYTTPVDAALAMTTPPPDTVVTLPDGTQVPIGGVPMLMAYALLQWFGESICELRKEPIRKKVLGIKDPDPADVIVTPE
jgi:hypothetical protein